MVFPRPIFTEIPGITPPIAEDFSLPACRAQSIPSSNADQFLQELQGTDAVDRNGRVLRESPGRVRIDNHVFEDFLSGKVALRFGEKVLSYQDFCCFLLAQDDLQSVHYRIVGGAVRSLLTQQMIFDVLGKDTFQTMPSQPVELLPDIDFCCTRNTNERNLFQLRTALISSIGKWIGCNFDQVEHEIFSRISVIPDQFLVSKLNGSPVLELKILEPDRRSHIFTIDQLELDLSSRALHSQGGSLAQSLVDYYGRLLRAERPEQINHNGFARLISWMTKGFRCVDPALPKILWKKVQDDSSIQLSKLLGASFQNHHSGHSDSRVAYLLQASLLLLELGEEQAAAELWQMFALPESGRVSEIERMIQDNSNCISGVLGLLQLNALISFCRDSECAVSVADHHLGKRHWEISFDLEEPSFLFLPFDPINACREEIAGPVEYLDELYRPLPAELPPVLRESESELRQAWNEMRKRLWDQSSGSEKARLEYFREQFAACPAHLPSFHGILERKEWNIASRVFAEIREQLAHLPEGQRESIGSSMYRFALKAELQPVEDVIRTVVWLSGQLNSADGMRLLQRADQLSLFANSASSREHVTSRILEKCRLERNVQRGMRFFTHAVKSGEKFPTVICEKILVLAQEAQSLDFEEIRSLFAALRKMPSLEGNVWKMLLRLFYPFESKESLDMQWNICVNFTAEPEVQDLIQILRNTKTHSKKLPLKAKQALENFLCNVCNRFSAVDQMKILDYAEEAELFLEDNGQIQKLLLDLLRANASDPSLCRSRLLSEKKRGIFQKIEDLKLYTEVLIELVSSALEQKQTDEADLLLDQLHQKGEHAQILRVKIAEFRLQQGEAVQLSRRLIQPQAVEEYSETMYPVLLFRTAAQWNELNRDLDRFSNWLVSIQETVEGSHWQELLIEVLLKLLKKRMYHLCTQLIIRYPELLLDQQHALYEEMLQKDQVNDAWKLVQALGNNASIPDRLIELSAANGHSGCLKSWYASLVRGRNYFLLGQGAVRYLQKKKDWKGLKKIHNHYISRLKVVTCPEQCDFECLLARALSPHYIEEAGSLLLHLFPTFKINPRLDFSHFEKAVHEVVSCSTLSLCSSIPLLLHVGMRRTCNFSVPISKTITKTLQEGSIDDLLVLMKVATDHLADLVKDPSSLRILNQARTKLIGEYICDRHRGKVAYLETLIQRGLLKFQDVQTHLKVHLDFLTQLQTIVPEDQSGIKRLFEIFFKSLLGCLEVYHPKIVESLHQFFQYANRLLLRNELCSYSKMVTQLILLTAIKDGFYRQNPDRLQVHYRFATGKELEPPTENEPLPRQISQILCLESLRLIPQMSSELEANHQAIKFAEFILVNPERSQKQRIDFFSHWDILITDNSPTNISLHLQHQAYLIGVLRCMQLSEEGQDIEKIRERFGVKIDQVLKLKEEYYHLWEDPILIQIAIIDAITKLQIFSDEAEMLADMMLPDFQNLIPKLANKKFYHATMDIMLRGLLLSPNSDKRQMNFSIILESARRDGCYSALDYHKNEFLHSLLCGVISENTLSYSDCFRALEGLIYDTIAIHEARKATPEYGVILARNLFALLTKATVKMGCLKKDSENPDIQEIIFRHLLPLIQSVEGANNKQSLKEPIEDFFVAYTAVYGPRNTREAMLILRLQQECLKVIEPASESRLLVPNITKIDELLKSIEDSS